MIRRLLWIVLFGLIGWIVRSLMASRKRGTISGAGAAEIPASEGRMVRDRVCNTFLPLERAIALEVEGARLYFCSERCRATFLEGRRAVS